ncbi:KAP family NTPase [Candidatus Parcubacteria bacterium]|nr:KAP family NTPase [Candidatus Parcubacteria bacterium]
MKDLYSSDRALNGKKNDLFSRASYASRIASVILRSKIEDSYVIGLYSPWGYGKTSTLNMLEESLGDDAIVIRFNPWSFDDERAIVRGMLTDISVKIDESLPPDTGQLKTFRRIRRKFTKGNALSAKESTVELMSRYGGYAGVVDRRLEEGITTTANILGGATNEKIKARIEDKIEESGKRIVIMVDDVDRLDEEEIFRLFKLIKVIADFKGVTYIVAFDDKAVAEALSKRFPQSQEDGNAGQEFIEKIIQIPLHLPLIERESLSDMLLQGIQGVVDINKIEISQDEVNRFRGIFDEYLAPRIKTPRMVKRYLNSLNFTVPLVANEVNITDFLVVEGVRLLQSNIYLRLRDNKALLTGTLFHIWLQSDSDDKKKRDLIDKIVGANNYDIKEIIIELFPDIKKAYKRHTSGYSRRELTKEKRVSSEDYFNRYFMYDLSPQDVADSAILEAIAKDTAPEIAEELERLFSEKRQKLVIRKLETYRKSARNPIEFARTLMQVFDSISDTKVSMFENTPMDSFVDLMRNVLNEASDKLVGYQLMVNECNNIILLTYIIREAILGSEPTKREPILSPKELDQFKQTALAKIRTEAQRGILHKTGNISHFLYSYWAEFGSKEETNAYLVKKLDSLEKILAFLTPQLGVWTGGNGSHRGNFNRETYNYVNKVVDPESLYQVAITEDPTLIEVDEYPDLEHDERNGIGKVGNENTDEFKQILAKQFVYIHQRVQAENKVDSSTDK